MNSVLNVFGMGEKPKDYKNNMPMSAEPQFDSENKTQQDNWASAKTPQDTQKPWYRFGFGGRKNQTKKTKKPKKQTKNKRK